MLPHLFGAAVDTQQRDFDPELGLDSTQLLQGFLQVEQYIGLQPSGVPAGPDHIIRHVHDLQQGGTSTFNLEPTITTILEPRYPSFGRQAVDACIVELLRHVQRLEAFKGVAVYPASGKLLCKF